MDAGILLVVGGWLCFFGAVSLRVGVPLTALGAVWLLADALGTSTTVATVLAVAAAIGVFVLALLAGKLVFFIGGACVGAVIGARLLDLLDLDAGDGRVVTALVVVPSVGALCGLLAAHWQRGFLRWGTAAAGAALLLAGIGRLDVGSSEDVASPDSAVPAALVAVAWIVLTMLGHRIQKSVGREDRKETETAV